MYEHVLLPMNGTEESETAVPHAFRIAQDRGATVHVLCAYSRGSRYGKLSVEAAEHREESLRDQAQRIVGAVADRAEAEGIETVTVTSEGDPTEVILAYIEDQGIDLVVMGGRKRSPAGKFLFGSVSQSVMLNTDTPVMVTGG